MARVEEMKPLSNRPTGNRLFPPFPTSPSSTSGPTSTTRGTGCTSAPAGPWRSSRARKRGRKGKKNLRAQPPHRDQQPKLAPPARGSGLDPEPGREPGPAGIRPPSHPERHQEVGDPLHHRLAFLCGVQATVPARGLPATARALPLPEKLGDVRARGPPDQPPQHRGNAQGVLRPADLHLPRSTPSSNCSPATTEETYKRLLEKIVAGSLIHADETEVNVKRVGKGYVWVFTNLEEVVYLYRPSREGDFLHDLLKGFRGVLRLRLLRRLRLAGLPAAEVPDPPDPGLQHGHQANPWDEELKSLASGFGTLLRAIVATIDQYGLKRRHLGKHRRDVDGSSSRLRRTRLPLGSGGGLAARGC